MSFDFNEMSPSKQSVADRMKQRRKQKSPMAMIAVGLGVICLAASVAAVWWLSDNGLSLVLEPIDDQTVDELDTLELTVALQNADQTPGPLKFALDDAPDGAQIDETSGRLTWTPTEEQGPDCWDITVSVAAADQESRVQQTFTVTVEEIELPPVMDSVAEQTVTLGDELALEIQAVDPDIPARPLRFRLGPDAPSGVTIDAVSGRFSWFAENIKPDDIHQITILVEEAVSGGLTTEQTFPVHWIAAPVAKEDPDVVIDRFVAALEDDAAEVVVGDSEFAHPSLSGTPRMLLIDGKQVAVFGYETIEAAQADIEAFAPDDLEPYTESEPDRSTARLFRGDHLVAFYVGVDATLLNRLDAQLGRPVVLKTRTMVVAEPEDPNVAGDDIILSLYEDKKLLKATAYPTLRKIYSDRFEAAHGEEIRQGLGEPDSAVRQWLDERLPIKEEFYLAIDPEHDNVAEVFLLFQQLHEEFPDDLETYASLAIAVSVVWDNERKSTQRSPCGQHGSTMPESPLGAMDNFEYFLEAKSVMQGRARFLPWEFLVHMVNHGTTLLERQWALTAYVPKRAMFGKCYSDVPYDHDLISGLEPHLQGQLHSLMNVRQFGAVCSGQADYAARVGKSIGVPAFSVSGKSRYGAAHAWVMWVELGPVTKTGFNFSLQSHGRYRGDRYYVGGLNDPHTGLRVTDRQLELRLHTVGRNPLGKRQTDLVMRSFPMLIEKASLDTTEQLQFLGRVIELSPGSEEAWISLANMSREGQITKAHGKLMTGVLNRLFVTFAAMPDFTWIVFDDLVTYEDLPKQRAALFGRVAGLYEQAGRPDLSCEARLKFAEYLVADDRTEDAILGLTTAVLLFPEEGNFVPKMLDKLDELCAQVDGQVYLVRFYQEFLPRIDQTRGKSPSSYCMQMYERGIPHFKAAGLLPLAQAYETQLAMLKARKN